MKRIFFACFSKEEFLTISPVLPILEKQGFEFSFLQPLFAAPDLSKQKNIKIFEPQPCSSAKIPGTCLHGDVKKSLSFFISGDRIDQVLALSVDAIRLSWSTPVELLGYLEGIKYYQDFVEKGFASYAPDLVVLVPGKTESEIVAGICAIQKRSHVFLLPPYLEFKVLLPFPFRPGVLHIVASEFGKKRLMRRGIDATHIVITGNPRMDSVLAFRNGIAKRPYYLLKKRLLGRSRTILYATEGLDQNVKLFELLRGYVRTRSHVKLHVRLHPFEPDGFLKGDGKKVIVSRKGNLFEDLTSSEALVTVSSTTMLEALILGIPVISFRTGFFPPRAVFSTEGDVLTAHNYRELENYLDQILFEPDFREAWLSEHQEAFEKYIGYSDGRAAQRLAAIIREALMNKPKEESVCYGIQSHMQRV